MAVSLSTAKQLCTKAELELFTQSIARNVRTLDKKALKSLVGRSRRLRDKYTKLANRQEREARGKQKPRRANPSQSSAATRKKELLFTESLGRFEKQLKKLETAEAKKAKPAKKPAAKKPKTAKITTVKKTSVKNTAGNKTAVKKAIAKKKAAAKSKPTVAPVSSIIEKSKRPKIGPAQHLAATKAKSTRVKVSGKAGRVRHLSAETRRRQAHRDAR